MPPIDRPSLKVSFDSVATRQIEQCRQIEARLSSLASARSERSLAISADCKLSTARAEEPRASVDRAHAFAMCTSCACAALPAGRELRARAVSALCSTAHSHLIRAIWHGTCAAHVSSHLGAVAPRLAAPGREHAQPPRGSHVQCKHQEPMFQRRGCTWKHISALALTISVGGAVIVSNACARPWCAVAPLPHVDVAACASHPKLSCRAHCTV